jgi:hypothetical protein
MTITREPNRPLCKECNDRPAKKGPKSLHGHQTWTNLCGSCDSRKYRKPRVVNLTCTACDFVAVDACQIDTVDGKSVCSNCNRLKIKAAKALKLRNQELTVDATVSIWDTRL